MNTVSVLMLSIIIFVIPSLSLAQIKEDPSIHFKKGNKLLGKKLIDQAISEYDIAIGINPEYKEAYCQRGIAYSKKFHFDKAIEDNSYALKLDGKLWQAYYNRGLAYDKKLEFIFESVIVDESVNNLYKEYPRTEENKIKLFDQALSDYAMVVKIKPTMINAYKNRASLFVRMNHLNEALTEFNKIIKIEPKKGENYYYRAKVYIKKAEFDKALDDLERAERRGFKVDSQDYLEIHDAMNKYYKKLMK